MKKAGSFSYSKNIFLDQTRMNELHSILIKYGSHLTIETTTIDGSSIEFESYKELMEYTNFKKGRIRELRIYGYSRYPWNKVFDLTFSPRYLIDCSLKCNYSFDDLDKETVFCKEIQIFLDKATNFYIPSLVGKIVLFCLIYLVAIFATSLQHSPIASIAVGVGLAIVYIIFLYFVWGKIFPLVSFSWGESISYYKRIVTLRSSLFWCVIVAFIIGIFVTFVSNGLFNT